MEFWTTWSNPKNYLMKNYHFQAKSGAIHMPSEFTRMAFKRHLVNNEGAIFDVVKRTPEESRSMRKFYHGAVITLWAYLDGKDYKDSALLEAMHEIAKVEFNGDFMRIEGKLKRYGKSTIGSLNEGFLNRVIEHLVENYGIDQSTVLDPKLYKKWKNEVWPFGGPETFIDYLIELKLLR